MRDAPKYSGSATCIWVESGRTPCNTKALYNEASRDSISASFPFGASCNHKVLVQIRRAQSPSDFVGQVQLGAL